MPAHPALGYRTVRCPERPGDDVQSCSGHHNEPEQLARGAAGAFSRCVRVATTGSEPVCVVPLEARRPGAERATARCAEGRHGLRRAPFFAAGRQSWERPAAFAG